MVRSCPPRVRARFVALAAAASLAASVHAQESAPPEPAKSAKEQQAQSLQAVVVTGTRTSTRTVAESLAPIDLLPAKALQQSGSSELSTVLSRILPSFNFPRPSVTDGTDTVKPAQLRGLSPDETLVLVDGKRWHGSALVNVNGSQGRGSSPVDLNAIPIYALQRVEVLRDGASAQYGSDAIAGVVNLVLKKGPGAGHVDSRVGEFKKHDGKLFQIGADDGFELGRGGWLRIAAEYDHQDFTNRAGPDTRFPGEPTFGTQTFRFGDPQLRNRMVFLNSELPLSDNVTFYWLGDFSKRNAETAGFFRHQTDSRNIPSIYPDGFTPLFENVSKDKALVAGLKGTAAGWNWDVSANYGSNRFDYNTANTLNVDLGPTSPTSFYDGTLYRAQRLVNADFSREFDFAGLQHPVNVAWGLESRHEVFTIYAGEPGSYFGSGSQVFPGYRPTDAGSHSRNSYAAYVDFEANLTDKLAAGLAARHEHYDDFGNADSGKLSLRYDFTDRFALRGTVSNGFRAPSLSQEFYQSTATVFIGGVPFDVRTFAVTDPVAVALGAEPLKPEKSRNYSIGMVAQPVDGLYFTLDAYQIDIDDRIILSENLTGSAVAAFLAANGFPNANGGRYFTNAADTRTRGVDLVGSYLLDLSRYGTLNLTLGYNHNKNEIRSIAPNPPQLSANGLALQRIGRVEQGRITEGTPRDKLSLGGDWTIDRYEFHADATRYGSFSVLNSNPTLDQTFGAAWVLDVSASAHFGHWTFSVGSDNVTNRYPDRVLFANSLNGILPYPQDAPFGFNGAFYYAKAAFDW
ncbi:MAG TPA: TonB-dependent receptor [Mizugakiibacter sp.]